MSRPKQWLAKIAHESGVKALVQSSRDVKILCAQRFVRFYAYGSSFLILVQFLSGLGIEDSKIGLFMTLTLLGDTVISFVLTLITDQVGRRNILLVGAALMTISGGIFAVTSQYWILLVASVIGVISPSGNEIGPFRAVEESILAQLSSKDVRSDVFAWYTMFGTLGASLGTITCGLIVQALSSLDQWSLHDAYRAMFVIYGVLGLIKFLLCLILGSEVEPPAPPKYQSLSTDDHDQLNGQDVASDSDSDEGASPQGGRPTKTTTSRSKMTIFLERLRSLFPYISHASRGVLARLIALFLIDSFASGLAAASWISYFFTSVHHLEPGLLGTLFLVTNLLATVSNLFALPLARRIGPLKTMVFTHLPSAILLALFPIPPPTPVGTWVTVLLMSLRYCTRSMDQAPRQAFITAAVLPSERTAVLGVVNVIKTLAQSGGLGLAGVLAEAKLWIVLFGTAGLLKVLYDLMLLWMFLGMKDRDEEPERDPLLSAANARQDRTAAPGDTEAI